MLEARVQMRFCREQHHMLEVGVVNVCINPEETLEYNFDYVDEVARERDSELARKHFFIVQLGLHPCH